MSLKKLHELKTVKGKRLRIVRDALLQMKLKKIVVTTGVYVDAVSDDFVSSNTLIGKFLKSSKKAKCEACALGSMLCGLTRSNGDFPLGIGGPHDELSKYFDRDNLRLIETAFEGSVIEGNIEDDDTLEACLRFYRKYPSAHQRLTAIFKNMLKNGGTFVP
jgi:hypothetical protein